MSFSLARAARESVDPFCASGGLFKIEQFCCAAACNVLDDLHLSIGRTVL
jgi:hypothetical protein